MEEAKKSTPRSTELSVTIDDTESTIAWPEGKVLVETLIEASLPARFSCTEGRCGACQCMITADGELNSGTEMLDNNFLDDEEIAQGHRLACQTLWTDASAHYKMWYDF